MFNHILGQPNQDQYLSAKSCIEKAFNLPDQNKYRIHNFFNFLKHVTKDNHYCGERKSIRERVNRNDIATDSNESQIITDCAQNGGSIDQAHVLVLKYQLEQGLPLHGRSSIGGIIKRLKLQKVALKKGKQ